MAKGLPPPCSRPNSSLGGTGREGAIAASDGHYARGTGANGQWVDNTHAAHQRGAGTLPDAVQRVAVSEKGRIAPGGAVASKRPPRPWR